MKFSTQQVAATRLTLLLLTGPWAWESRRPRSGWPRKCAAGFPEFLKAKLEAATGRPVEFGALHRHPARSLDRRAAGAPPRGGAGGSALGAAGQRLARLVGPADGAPPPRSARGPGAGGADLSRGRRAPRAAVDGTAPGSLAVRRGAVWIEERLSPVPEPAGRATAWAAEGVTGDLLVGERSSSDSAAARGTRRWEGGVQRGPAGGHR